MSEQNTAVAQTPEQIEAAKQAFHAGIQAKFDNKVDVKETNFHFRKSKDEKSGVETKRPTVTIPVPVPSVEGIVAILESGNTNALNLLLDAVAEVVYEQAREHINNDEKINAENFPYEKLAWQFIADLPKAERRGGGISKEVWEEFAKDYQAVMPGATGKTAEQVELAAKVFLSKFASAKTNKPVLKVLRDQLAIYTNNTQRLEEFAACVEFLDKKAETLINSDETSLLNAL